eukprot:TRINITY_DN39120_c0_g1_i2.p1 TRINITY_DN39120_c0_g1~~TRINITY_DN39120_c0_g1_i2.p1  ORF type:complete len:497 (-),score=44.96 TRINITY_DN39120_c0_g1_i2:5-1474(-)
MSQRKGGPGDYCSPSDWTCFADRPMFADFWAPDRDFTHLLDLPFLASPGDCLGWAVEAGGSGGIAWGGRGHHGKAVQVAKLAENPQFQSTQLQLHSELRFEKDLAQRRLGLGRPLTAWWINWPATKLATLQPRSKRINLLKAALLVTPERPISTSTRFKRDFLDFFSEPHWANSSIIELGANAGETTQMFAQMFTIVFAVESFEFALLLEGPSRNLHNVVHLAQDSLAPFSLRRMSSPGIRVMFIDTSHDTKTVFYETYQALQDLCCLSLVVYHDYCFSTVQTAVQIFVDSGLLTFRHGLGLDNWCADTSSSNNRHLPEGAVFQVNRDLPHFKQILEKLHLDVNGLRTSLSTGNFLNGTTWLLFQQHFYGFLTFYQPPSLCRLRVCKKMGACDQHPHAIGMLRLEEWRLERGLPFKGSVLRGTIQIPKGRRRWQRFGVSQPQLSFDRYMSSFTAIGLDEFFSGIPSHVIGVQNFGSIVQDLNTWHAQDE